MRRRGGSGTTVTTSTTQSTTTTTATETTSTQTQTTAAIEDQVVKVAVKYEAQTNRNFSRMLRPALAYWTLRSSKYTNRDVTFRYTPNLWQADIKVRVVDSIEFCDGSSEVTVGCARLGSIDDALQGEQVSLRIEKGYSASSTRQVIKHELGHVLGIDHNEEPIPLMNASSLYYTVEQKNATERENPWRNQTLAVYVKHNAAYSDRLAKSEVSEALQYYENGAGGWMAENKTPNFVWAESKESADIVFNLTSENACGFDTSGICGSRYGVDPDGDGALEYYTHATVVVASLPKDNAGWWAGAMLGYSMGATEKSELPKPFRDQENADDWDGS